MKTLRISLYSATIVIIGFLYSGCIDEPVMPQGNYVSGSIYDIYGSKYELGGRDEFYISPGNAPITIASDKFTINTFGIPYDLVITSYLSNFAIKFNNVKLNNVMPVFNDPRNAPYYNWEGARLYIKIPPVTKECMVFVKFISDRTFMQFSYYFPLRESDSSVSLEIYLPAPDVGFPDISGRFLYLETNDWNSYSDIEYNKFGMKYFDSVFANYHTIEFKESDISFNPPEAMTSFSNIRPPGTSHGGETQISFSIEGEHSNSDLILLQNMPDNVSTPIPVLPIEGLRVKYKGGYETGSYHDYGFRQIFVNPGQSAEIVHNVPVQLVSPSNDDSNINGSTVFKVNDDNTPGVFRYEFYRYGGYGSKYLSFFTTSRTLTFSEITARGFEWKPNCSYYWWVSKLPEYENVDAVLSTHYLLDERYNNVQLSQVWVFKTGP